MAGLWEGIGAGVSGLADMGIGALTEGFNALQRAGAGQRLEVQGGQIFPLMRFNADATGGKLDSINQNEQQQIQGLRNQTTGNPSNPWFQTGPSGGPQIKLPTSAASAQANPSLGVRSDFALQNYGTLFDRGANDIEYARGEAERAYAAINEQGDAALDSIVDTVGTGLSGYSASTRESIDARNAEIDAQVRAGGLPPAAAEQLKQTNKLQAASQMRDQARQLIGERANMLASTHLTISNQLSSTMASFNSTIGGMASNYINTLAGAGESVQNAVESDRQAARASAAWTESLIRSDANNQRQAALSSYSMLNEALAFEYGGDRDVASIYAGIALNPQNMAGFSNTWQNVVNNKRAAEQAQPQDSGGWF